MSERTEDAKKIIAAIEELVGGPFELSRQQSYDSTRPLRKGTAEEVIAVLPEQIENLRRRAAQAIPGWEAHEVELKSIAPLLTISLPTRDRSSNNLNHIFEQMDRYDIWKEAYEDGLNDGYDKCQEDMVQSLYQDALMRPAEKAGLVHHIKELDDGRSFFQKALDFYYSPERQRLLAQDAAR